MERLRILLYPFSILYDGITGLRNVGFDKGWISSHAYDIPIIAVGNLSTGGTGKTPMIEYLVKKYQGKRIAILSRGYGRNTSGYREVLADSKAIEVGDEPLQYKSKFKSDVIVAVCEKRADGIDQLLHDHDLDLILLDDAFQHRQVKASRYILLSSYDQPYYDDYLLPAGNLRESRTGATRADSIVITKCPADLSPSDMQKITLKINPQPNQKVYFTTIAYSHDALGNGTRLSLEQLKDKKVTVITGIAKPEYFLNFLKSYTRQINHLNFPDHYNFKTEDLDALSDEDLIITTEKDYVRLKDLRLRQLFYIPIETKFLGQELQINISDNW